MPAYEAGVGYQRLLCNGPDAGCSRRKDDGTDIGPAVQQAVWDKDAEQVKQALEGFEAANKDAGASLTITKARRIASSVTGKPSGSIVLERAEVAPAEPTQHRR